MAQDKSLVVVDGKEIQNMIYTIRGKQVMVDSDLAELYKVTTGNLNKAMKRNLSRFPKSPFQAVSSSASPLPGPPCGRARSSSSNVVMGLALSLINQKNHEYQ